jgi:hypothetical protein
MLGRLIYNMLLTLRLAVNYCRKYGQPSTGDCTLTSFENFNDRELWETQNCFNHIADFFICEKQFSPDRENPKRISYNHVEIFMYLFAVGIQHCHVFQVLQVLL